MRVLNVELAPRFFAGPAEALPPEAATGQRLRLVLPLRTTGTVSSDTPPLASAAAAVLVEGLKRMGARASRPGLTGAHRDATRCPRPACCRAQLQPRPAYRHSGQHRHPPRPRPRHDRARKLADAALNAASPTTITKSSVPLRPAMPLTQPPNCCEGWAGSRSRS